MKRHFAAMLVALALAWIPFSASAQGCSQCKDNVAASSPRTQQGFRRAIVLLGTTAIVVFCGTLLVAWRQRRD